MSPQIYQHHAISLVSVLSMITAYRHRRIHSHNIALFYEELACLVA